MKTVFLLFDSLNRRMLSSYGSALMETPNFQRLSEKSITFDNHYIGSMPCIPARRDLHTGRLNFLHRSWGPLEPFDNSFAEILKSNNTYSHLITDHFCYWLDGGLTYHNRFSSYDFIRGQHADPWKAMVQPPLERFKEKYHSLQMPRGFSSLGDSDNNKSGNDEFFAINSEYIKEEKDFPSVQCFAAGLEFLETNKSADNWFLQIETFDPHEPFFAPERFREKFKTNYKGPILDWPPYERVKETPDEIAEIRANYMALVSLCDFLLGSILDYFDKHNLWNDTALILTTDHGFMLGEHDWWAKAKMPMYNEIAHIPLFVYHPDFKKNIGERRSIVTQNIDLMPTFLEIYGKDSPSEVQGKSLLKFLEKEEKTNYSALYGYWGGGINVANERYTYFQYPDNMDLSQANIYTLMPQTLRQFFTLDELKGSELHPPFSFTKGVPVLKFKHIDWKKSNVNGAGFVDTQTSLYDLKEDPGQLKRINDLDIENRMKEIIMDKIIENDAPKELVERFKS